MRGEGFKPRFLQHEFDNSHKDVKEPLPVAAWYAAALAREEEIDGALSCGADSKSATGAGPRASELPVSSRKTAETDRTRSE